MALKTLPKGHKMSQVMIGSITWVEVKTGSPIAKKLSGTADSSMFLGYLG